MVRRSVRFSSAHGFGLRLFCVSKKQNSNINPLFKSSPPGVQKLAREASKNSRVQARAEWWAKNKPTK